MMGVSVPAEDCRFTGVKVFSATMVDQRANLGESVTAWIEEHPELAVLDVVLTQSSDERFHCVAVSVFYTGVTRGHV